MSPLDAVLRWARGNDRVRTSAGRAVDAVVARSSVPPPSLRPGAWAAGRPGRPDDSAVVVLDCAGVAADALQALVDALPQVSLDAGPLRFVLVVDGPLLAVGRRAGVVVEHLVDVEAWSLRHDRADWPAYRERRFEQIRRTYRPHQVVALADADPARLTRAVRAPAPPSRPARAWSRLEARLDPPPRG